MPNANVDSVLSLNDNLTFWGLMQLRAGRYLQDHVQNSRCLLVASPLKNMEGVGLMDDMRDVQCEESEEINGESFALLMLGGRRAMAWTADIAGSPTSVERICEP